MINSKKMRNSFALFLILISSIFTFGQENIQVCNENQTSFDAFIKENKFSDAEKLYPTILKSCPSANENFYLNAEKLFLHNIEFVKNETEKTSEIQKLIKVYDLYDKKFPENKNGNAIKKALYWYDNKLATNQEIFNVLDKVFTIKPNDFNNPRAFYIYFELYENLSKLPNSTIKPNDLIDKNISISEKNSALRTALEEKISNLNSKQKSANLSSEENAQLKNYTNDLRAFTISNDATKGMLSPYSTCQNFSNYCTTNFEKQKNNDFWLQYTSNEMFAKACFTSDIFNKIVAQSNVVHPTSKSNYLLGYATLSKGDATKALEYFNESVRLENDIRKKADLYYTIATSVYGINDKPNAAEYLKKAIATDTTFGKPYLYLAQLYFSSINECTKTEFEKKAIYWLIASTVDKAGATEAYLKPTSLKLKTDYLKNVPTSAEIETAKMAGKQITFGCFINETIDVPKK